MGSVKDDLKVINDKFVLYRLTHAELVEKVLSMTSDLGEIKELFDCDLSDEDEEDGFDSRYDEEKLLIAHRIASKY